MNPSLLASFSKAARAYHEHAGVQELMAGWVGAWLPKDRSGRALELGAGPGTFTRHLFPWTGELTASDISPAMCAAGKATLPDLTWRVMSAEAPAKGPWDWIFCSSLLQWTTKPVDVFSAWRRELALGGRILGGLFVSESLPELAALAGKRTPLTWRTADEWRAFLSLAGLSLLRDASERRVFYHPSARAFLRNLHGVGAAPERRLTPAAMRRLLLDYEKQFGGPKGVRATWTFYRFEVAAK